MKGLIIQDNKLTIFIFIMMFLFTSCTNHFITNNDLCDKSCCYWDYYPYDTIEYNNLRFIVTSTLKFCKNDSVYSYVFTITDSLRRTSDDPQSWKLERDKLIISNNDTIIIDSLFNDTLFTRHIIFDSLKCIKLVRNSKKVKEKLGKKIVPLIL